jgi:hypothetical protein
MLVSPISSYCSTSRLTAFRSLKKPVDQCFFTGSTSTLCKHINQYVILYVVHWFELVRTELNHIELVQNGSARFGSGSNLIDLVLVLVRAIDLLN